MLQEPKIVFHHIPKCGGQSIVSGLALTYYPWQILRYGRKGFPAVLNAKATQEISPLFGIENYQYRRQILSYFLAKNDSNFVGGHYPFSQIAYQAYKDNWTFVTLFRDPVKRWYSEYYWNRYKDHEYAKTELDIEEYLESKQGRMNTRSYTNFLHECETPDSQPNDKELQGALTALECFDVLGCLEDLNKFRADMKAKFGRKPYFRKKNTSPAPPDVERKPDEKSDFHKKLLTLLEADREIYRRVREKLQLD